MKHSIYSTYMIILKILYVISFTNIFATSDSTTSNYDGLSILEMVSDIDVSLMNSFPILDLIDGLCVEFFGDLKMHGDHLYLGECEKIIRFELCSTYLDEVPLYILSFKCIEHLNFYGTNLTSSCFNIISRLITLKTLNMEYCVLEEIPDSILNLKNLEELYLSVNSFTYITTDLNELNLKKLILTNIDITNGNDTCERNVSNVVNRFLEIKTLEHLEIGEIDLWNLDLWIEDSSIKRLTLNNCNLYTLPDSIIKLKKLEYLDLRYNELDHVPPILSEFKNLKELKLTENSIISYENLTFYSLESLHIECSKDSNRMISISNSSSSFLQHLHIHIYKSSCSKVELNSSTIKNLKSLYQYVDCIIQVPEDVINIDNLERLRLRGNFSNNILDIIYKSKNLKEVDLNLNNLKDYDFDEKLLPIFKNNKNLEYLSLCGNNMLLDDKICDIESLKKLQISSFRIDKIACFSKLKALESIIFEYIKFSESKKDVNLFLEKNKIKFTYSECTFNCTPDLKKEEEVVENKEAKRSRRNKKKRRGVRGGNKKGKKKIVILKNFEIE